MLRQFVIVFLFFLLAFVSCKKPDFDLNLTEHTEQRIIGEGYFTDSLKKHQFTFTLSNNLGSENLVYANEISLLIKTPEGPVSFNRIDDGLFESTEPFKGVPDVNYTVQFSYKGNVHEVVTKMPTPINIRSYDFVSPDSIQFGQPGEIDLVVDSPTNQFLKFDLYRADTLLLPEDTIWNKVNIPVYQIAPIYSGDSNLVSIPIDANDSYYPVAGELVKLKTYIISTDVGDYLSRLRNYVTSELLNSQFYNPPYYYSNQAYGLGYGTIIDSTIFQY